MEEKSVGERNMNKQKQRHEPLPCPRCMSLNTKFCYYNNHSLSQPRYFCKDCRRNWTHGGALRNIPVGGKSHKHKNSEFSSSSWPQQPPLPPPQPPSNSEFSSSSMMQSFVDPFYQGGNNGYLSGLNVASHSDYSQNYFINNGNNMNYDSSLRSSVINSSNTSLSGNTERKTFATDSSPLNPNLAHPWSYYH